MIDSKLIDSSVWLSYFFNGTYADVIDSEEIFLLSVLSLFEIKTKLIKSNLDSSKIIQSIDFIKKKSLIIPLDVEITEKAIDFAINNNLPTVDSLIYATAINNNSQLITLDNDFRDLSNVLILSRD